ncbi:MAG: hypothetical protein AAB513_03320 [Patescibacteria group bacterium]
MIIAIGQWMFLLALLPSILGKDKPAIATSVFTGLILATFVIAYFSISLWVSAISTSLVSLGWFILAYQKYKSK